MMHVLRAINIATGLVWVDGGAGPSPGAAVAGGRCEWPAGAAAWAVTQAATNAEPGCTYRVDSEPMRPGIPQWPYGGDGGLPTP